MTQNDTILKHLRTYGSITQHEAFSSHQIMRLASRINELRNNFNIQAEQKVHKVTGKRYVRYHLAEDDVQRRAA